jgi:hypothetical protein
MPSFNGPSKTNTTTRSFMNTLLSRLPYTYKILDDVSNLNPKYEEFHELTQRKDERIAQQSILLGNDNNENGVGNAALMINKDYHNYMYANTDVDKIRRIQQYRRMAAYSEVSDAIDEICDETIVKSAEGDIVQFHLQGKYNDDVKKEVKKEWKKFIEIFNLEDKGWELFRSFLIDGELFFENIISQNKPEYGVLGLIQVPTELINPVYDNLQNSIVKGFLLRKQREQDKKEKGKEDIIVFDKNQITYVHSGLWNEDRSMRIPYIENCRRAYKQLSLIEDSIVIYRLVRAPERLVFYIDVGNMPTAKAEAHLQRMMRQFWSRKTYDTSGKSVMNVYDPQSMLDSFWFAKKQNSEGTKVETLPGGQNLGQLDDLMYFVKKLYKSLKVPLGRLNPEDAFKDAQDMTREELRFAKFIMRLQRQFAIAIRDSFIVHLKLRKIWERHSMKETDVNLAFNTPTHFMMMREQQLFDMKYTNFNNMANNELVSKSFAQRHYMDWSDEMMAENREWLRKDSEFMWEIEQIRTNGPNFRDKANALESAVGEIAGGGAGGASVGAAQAEVGGFKPKVPPEFGPAPSVGGVTAANAPTQGIAPAAASK